MLECHEKSCQLLTDKRASNYVTSDPRCATVATSAVSAASAASAPGGWGLNDGPRPTGGDPLATLSHFLSPVGTAESLTVASS